MSVYSQQTQADIAQRW